MIISNLPQTWNDITLSQYQELIELESDSEINNFDRLLEQLAIVCNTSSDDEMFEELDIDEVFSILDKIKWINKKPSNQFKNKIDVYSVIELNTLKLGEFIDLEHFFNIDYVQNLHIICAILYKQTEQDKWNNTEFEPYIYNIYKRSEFFLEQPITYLYGIIKCYLDFKETFEESYNALFDDNSGIIENEEELDAEELAEIKKEIAEEKVKSQWSWESIIHGLCVDNITYKDAVLNAELIYTFNILSMKKTLGV
jgi:hypothetical protein